MSTRFSLDRLIEPVSVETFFREYWESKPLLVQRGRPDYFASLLSSAEVDRVITTLGLHHPALSLVSAAREIPVGDYTYPSGMVDVARLYQHFADGATIILTNLEARVAALADLCRAMEARVCARFQTNIYFTPRNAQGFKTHYDSHDVFVLQVEGTKHWVLYDTPVELPFRGQRFDPRTVRPGAVSMEFELRPGDMVYIPRGVMHDASTGEGDSLHITLGALATSWTDLLIEAVAAVGLREPHLRKALPAGFARADFDRAAARETFRELMRKVFENADFDAALDHFADDLISTRHPLLWGQLEQVRSLGALGLDSVVGARPDLLYRVREEGEQVVVSCYGNNLTMPRHAAEALRFALASPQFRVRDLPSCLDDAGKLVLVRRLVREGLLRVC